MPQQISTLIIIPVYNGRDSLLSLISGIGIISDLPILVVDDGSTDDLSKEDLPNCLYHRHSRNMGKGAALKSGLDHARSAGFTHALTLDADGQHAPAQIKDFLGRVVGEPTAFLIGKRDLVHESMPFHRKLSNNITSLMLSLRSGLRIHDSQVGYRCYPLNNRVLWDSIEDGFQFESDVLLRAGRLNIRLDWIPIPVIYSQAGSHMHLVKDTLRFVRTFIRSFQC